MFGQDFELTMQDSHTLQSLLQHNPKTFNEFKVFGLRCQFMCESYFSSSVPIILSQFEPDKA